MAKPMYIKIDKKQTVDEEVTTVVTSHTMVTDDGYTL